MGTIVVLGVIASVFSGLGWYVSAQRGRPVAEGAVLGFLFGPLGVLVALLLPSAAPAVRTAPRAARVPSVTPYERWAQAMDDRDEEQAYQWLAGAGEPGRALQKNDGQRG